MYLARLRAITTHPLALSSPSSTWGTRNDVLAAQRDLYAWSIDTPITVVSVDAAIEAVIILARNDAALNPASCTAFTRRLTRLRLFLRFHGVEHLTDITQDQLTEFVAGATARHGELRDPAAATIRGRRWMLGRFLDGCVQLGWPLTLTVPRVASTRDPGPDWARPLTDEEMHRCQAHAQLLPQGDLVPVAIALAQAGADTGEIWQVRVGDIDLNDGLVHFAGNARHNARANALTDWGCEILGRRINDLWYDASLPVAVNASTTGTSATAAIAQRLRTGLDRAGLTRDPHVRPGSIRAWSAASIFAETHRIEAVAMWLGYRRLDHASRIIGYHWLESQW